MLIMSAAYLIEIFPYAQRARGISIFQFWGKAAQFFSTNVNPIGTAAIGWKYLLVYCCWIFVEAVLIWFLWPETSGRSLEELAFRASPTPFYPFWIHIQSVADLFLQFSRPTSMLVATKRSSMPRSSTKRRAMLSRRGIGFRHLCDW
jgi:hypothetical protein